MRSKVPRPGPSQKIGFLRDPRNHPRGTVRVEVRETHFAWVFLTRDQVYKLKKPLRHGAMDYRSLPARRRGCENEVRLNRRLAPDVYRSVESLSTDRSGRLRWGAGGRIEDYLVKMRRLPARRMLDRVLADRPLGPALTARLAGLLAAFFRSAVRRPLGPTAYLERLRRQVQGDDAALRRLGSRLDQRQVERTTRAARRVLGLIAGELAARGRRVVEGHGDLRVEHVCLGPPISIIDCVEFEADLRRLDPAADLSHLALELERLGYPEDAWRLLDRYRALAEDPVDDAILHFYLGRSAVTRAKLAAWHVGDPQFPDARPWLARARALLGDGLRHLRLAARASRASGLKDPAAATRRATAPPARIAACARSPRPEEGRSTAR